MKDLPVTIRLLDPPLHEFLPHDEKSQQELAAAIGVSADYVAARVSYLHESNPMLGHRGCRLSITYPEILDMQVQAITEAAINCRNNGIQAFPEVMIPLVGSAKELAILREQAISVIERTKQEKNFTGDLPIPVGTMIEIPRAALTADEVAKQADFFSFGTNDLTQMTFGFSRDDIGTFLPEYLRMEIFDRDPFQGLDASGVGQLVEMGVNKGRSTNSSLKVGICGEHGGDPASISFCDKVGLDYVSCSPFRVSVARLAAAQSALEK
jgi:pyruvate,orthophosphate dikinase